MKGKRLWLEKILIYIKQKMPKMMSSIKGHAEYPA